MRVELYTWDYFSLVLMCNVIIRSPFCALSHWFILYAIEHCCSCFKHYLIYTTAIVRRTNTIRL